MWRDIFLSNRDAMLTELAEVRAVLDRAERAIADGDGAGLQALLETAAQARRDWRKGVAEWALCLILICRARAARRGEMSLPGSKSISNRVLLLAALAEAAPRSPACWTRTTPASC